MASPYFPARAVLFQKEPSGVTYRVPALVYLPGSSCFLAFCEERLSPADAQANLLVMRRGSYRRGHVEWEAMKVLPSARLQGHSVDQGDTWSTVTDLTENVIGDTIKEWATFALGPGHGIQLKSGRLLVPAYAYHIDCRECFGRLCVTTPHSFCFHSDTHGRTWRFGEAVPALESVECQMVSVDQEDGTNVLYCNARSPLGCRVQALSLDDGAVFQDGQLVQKLVEPPHGCHGSVIGFPAPIRLPGRAQTAPGTTQKFLTPTWVVYSHPTWPNTRRDLGVHLSPFPRDPDSWSEPWVIYKGPSAYSDLACIEPPSPGSAFGTVFACLYESGTRTAYDEISFSTFTLYELLDNIPQRTPASGRESAPCGLCSVS
ncbi:sialidase-4 [Scleropages formosus]|uniref:sialidase-4 n=1 Tax=Scleropages formosus TaxID=113540 RepID=UPI0010FAAB41|nr:sialidase-4 [Scleropages formosus]